MGGKTWPGCSKSGTLRTVALSYSLQLKMGRLPQPLGMQTGYCVMCNIQANAVPSLGCHLGNNKRWGQVEGEQERKFIINRRSRTDKYMLKWRRSRKPELTQGVSWRNNKSRKNPACKQKRMSQGMMPRGPGQPEGGPPHSSLGFCQRPRSLRCDGLPHAGETPLPFPGHVYPHSPPLESVWLGRSSLSLLQTDECQCSELWNTLSVLSGFYCFTMCPIYKY